MFHTNPVTEWITITLLLGKGFIAFISKFCLIYPLQLLFIKFSKSFFTVEITINICPCYSILHNFNHKNFFGPIWSIALCKNISVIWYPYMISNFEYRIYIIILKVKLIYVRELTSAVFILNVLWHVLMFLSAISSGLLMFTFFGTAIICL